MGEFASHGPLLLTALMSNHNNSAQAQVHTQAISGTVVVSQKVVEVIAQDQAPGSLDLGIIHLRAESPNPKGLTQAQHQFYDENGYVILPDAITSKDAELLLEEIRDITKRIAGGAKGFILYDSSSTHELPSPIGRVLATFEAVPSNSLMSPLGPVCRLGCAVHQKLPRFRAITHSRQARAIAESLCYVDPRITQSQVISKLARVGSSIVPHHDGCVSFTDPPSGLTFWYALEDATLENGCLCVAAGSHLTEPLRQRLVGGDDGVPRFEDLDIPVWAKGVDVKRVVDKAEHGREEERKYTPLEVRKGSLVVFHGNLMHQSVADRSGKDRMAYTFSVIEGQLGYADDGYLNVAGEEMDRL